MIGDVCGVALPPRPAYPRTRCRVHAGITRCPPVYPECYAPRLRFTLRIVCPVCRHLVTWARHLTPDQRARAEGVALTLVCGSRRCGASVRTMSVFWEKESHV